MFSSEVVAAILAHHGVKGMRWGVRRDRSSSVTVSDKGKRLKTSGGHGRSAHPDAVRVRTIGQVSRKSGFKALSNEELQAFNQRLNLEQQAKRLRFNDSSPPKKFVLKLLGQTGQQTANEISSTASAAAVKKILAAAAAA
jgi:hypothetical protein